MGNQLSHGDVLQGKGSISSKSPTLQSNGSKKEKPLSRTPSASDFQDAKYTTHLLPIDKLAKVKFYFNCFLISVVLLPLFLYS